MRDLLDQFRLGRHEFENGRLEGIEGIDPYDLFELWMQEAVDTREREPNAFVLSTVDGNNVPSSRIVYLKDVIEQGFIFYTNYNSKKGKNIAENSNVSMLFFWPNASRQIRIEGVCTKVDESISDAYFASRPRGSQIGAWASEQSNELGNITELEERVKTFENKFTENVPRPPHWGGYRIQPVAFEFWQGRPSRLHDRITFTAENDQWNVQKLNP
ncbi:MAG: pyridoxamine 5'-phosphate oxidase [Crocinitomicaceae bacterium]|nr:pyridoxamine 5'-phosphate oxidase [Crocinitomicaceae bacterium]